MPYSNISVSLDQAQLGQIIAQVKALKASLPFLVGLTAEERHSLRKMGDQRTSFVQDIKTATLANAQSIPSEINVTEFAKDVDLITKLDSIIAELQPFYTGLLDTNMALGSEAMKVADVCYGHLKFSARSNPKLKETVETLSQRFKQVKKAKIIA